MQQFNRHQSMNCLSLTLTAAAALAFTSPAHAQGKPYYVGEGTSLRRAADRFDRTLGALQLKEQNGGLIELGDYAKIDEIVFPAGIGEGIEGAGVEETGSCGGGIEGEVRTRLRERAIELADQPAPVRYEDVRDLKLVILVGQVEAALAELASAGPSEPGVLTSILPFPTSVAGQAFADLVRYSVDPDDERQVRDAEVLIAEFTKALEGDVERMRQRKSVGFYDTRLILTEFRMNVERKRARRAVEAGASPAPAMIHFASLFRQRERLAKGVGIAN